MTEQGSRYRWWILTMACIANFLVIGLSWMSMPVLFLEISNKMGWAIPAILFSWGLIPLAVVFVSLPVGILGDRFGIRWVAGLGIIATGLTGIGRGMADSLTSFQIAMFLFGCTFPFPYILLPKTVGVWFPARELGKANGILQSAYAAGAALALMLSGTVISPRVGGWQNVMYLWGALSVAVGIAWVFTVRDKPAEASPGPSPDIRLILGTLLRNRMILTLCLVYFLFLGGWIGATGALPALAATARGMSPAAANNIVAVALCFYVLGAFLVPTLSDRIGLRRPVYCIGLLAAGLGMCLTFQFPPPQIWLWAGVWGIAAGAIPIVFALPFEMKEVGPALGGTATALILVAGFIGGFVFPAITAFITARMNAGASMVWIGIVCGLVGYAASGLAILGARETGRRAQN
jgi:nitrate/nitrite transporter NarK